MIDLYRKQTFVINGPLARAWLEAHRMYRESLHLWIAEVEDRISLRPAPGYVVEVLKTEKLGFVERRALDADGQLIEYSHTWFNADICHYNARWT